MSEQNPNLGGTGDSAMKNIVTKLVSVDSPDRHPDAPALPGPTFLSGSPAGREAQPVLKEGTGKVPVILS